MIFDIMESIRQAAGVSSGAKPQEQEEPACKTCLDEGQHMDMRCYGGPPVEVLVWCVDCGGSLAGVVVG